MKLSNYLLSALAVLLIAGCAQERPPIDRVQPLALEKSYFVGESFVDTSDDPEFWTQATLIDVGYGASQDGLFTSTYAQPMSRIRWQITEDLLIGRISYERIEGSDGKGLAGPVQDGVIAAAFRIIKHFDIERAYNSTTGERLNIVNENSSDRPWYNRTHMRVDWSRNLNVDSYDFDTLSLLGIYGGIRYEPLAYDVTDPNHPHAPVFETDTGYFDITTKAFAAPEALDLRSLGWGIDSFPACFLPADFSGGTAPVGNCNPVELTVRHSFRKVVDSDYEPMDWDGYRFQAYGAFYVERQGYSRNYRMTDDRWHRFITRYNLWVRSHYYTDPIDMTGPILCYTPETTPNGLSPNRDENSDGTADECEAAGAGSQCDTFNQKCTLPYTKRNVRPIVWYYTQGSDQNFFEGTRAATHEWDVALRTAVRSAQLAECVKTNGDDCQARFPMYSGQQEMNDDAIALAWEKANCMQVETSENRAQVCDDRIGELGAARGYNPAVISIAQMPSILALCHSPVQDNDPSLCQGKRLPADITAVDCERRLREPLGDGNDELYLACMSAHRVRPGDLRYHQINVIEEPQTPSPWGIYTDSEDPLTGETIAASINVWSWVNDFWAQSVVDQMRLIKGELDVSDITEGQYVKNWAQAAQNAHRGHFHGQLERSDAEAKVQDFTQHEGEIPSPDSMPSEARAFAKELRKELTHVHATMDAPSEIEAIIIARANQAAGSEFEAELMTPMMQEFHGMSGLPLTEPLLAQTSAIRGGNPMMLRRLEHLKEVALAERGACIRHQAPAPMALTSLASAMEEKFGAFNPDDDQSVQLERAEKIRKYISGRAHTAVIMHEMGHSVGLRHNFVSSSDPFNYRPQYWQLRTKNGSVSNFCDELSSDGEDCIGPRYHDPMTQQEQDNLQHMFMHSSVMDYAGEITQDFMGLGAYDFAAARMFYGDTVAVYKDDDLSANDGNRFGLFNKMDNFGGILGFSWNTGDEFGNHYSKLQDTYELIKDCGPVDIDSYKPQYWDEEKNGKWHPTLDGQIVAVDGEYSRCKTRKVTYKPWTALAQPTLNQSGGGYRGGPAVTEDDEIRVPYGFGTDSWADTGNLSVFRHDNGADAYELFEFLIAKQEVDHIFTNYRRERTGFSVRSAASRALGRYNTKLRDAAKGLGLYRNLYSAALTQSGYNAEEEWPIIANDFFKNNIIAAGMAFDHFARMLTRPEHGPHYYDRKAGVLRSTRDTVFLVGEPPTRLNVPNGPSGMYGDVSFGGRPVENQLANDKGEYDNEYTINAGSYYEKLYTTFLLTESADNFISASRTDFVDARGRAVSMADLFPDGFRRLMAHGLTNDEFFKGNRVVADGNRPVVDDELFPANPIGWTSWWGKTPRVCFPANGTTVCSSVGNEAGDGFDSDSFAELLPIDSQVGWEQQKFMIAWTLLYLPSNQKQEWIDQLRVWELGVDADPELENRIELHLPSGKVYVARTYGKEKIFGRTVQRGIAARVLEYANQLLQESHEVQDGPDLDEDGQPDWYLPLYGESGLPLVKYSPDIRPTQTCSEETNSGCACTANLGCIALRDYAEVPFFIRQTLDAYRLGAPSMRGVY
jgi:hypothetical protein